MGANYSRVVGNQGDGADKVRADFHVLSMLARIFAQKDDPLPPDI